MKFQILSLLAAGGALVVNGQNAPVPTPAGACGPFQTPTVPGATVVSVQAAERRGVTVATTMMTDAGPQPVPPLDICDVNVTLSHGLAGDMVRVEVWMPLNNFTGRYQATGGGGFVAGTFGQAMAPQVAVGFAASSTDAGIPPGTSMAGVLNNTQVYQNFQSLSYHEMALVSKDMITQFYGKPPTFSYWNGCSTGGRQGYVAAQVFPADFNGILAAAPAINFDRFSAAGLWTTVAQAVNNNGEALPQCVFQAMRQAHVDVCDVTADDAAQDGVIQNPYACTFDATSMVGRQLAGGCVGSNNNSSATTITAQHVAAYQAILQGPRSTTNGTQLWYGWMPGANVTLGGGQQQSPAASWAGNALVQQLGLANATISAAAFEQVFARSIGVFNNNLSATNANLAPFRAAGGKLLTWHGLYDNQIFPEGTFDYHQRVQNALGGSVDDFYRVFEAPGVGHCGNGVGPVPLNPINALVAWVEQGVAPDTLPALRMNGTQAIRRNVCRFGFSARFMGGVGANVNDAAGWTCAPAQQNFTFVDVPGAPGASNSSGPVTVSGATQTGFGGLGLVAAMVVGVSLVML